MAEIKTPVVLQHGESNELYDFGSLSKDWLNRGKHLVTGAPIELNDYVAAMTFIKPL